MDSCVKNQISKENVDNTLTETTNDLQESKYHRKKSKKTFIYVFAIDMDS